MVYQDHEVFSILENLADFYEFLSDQFFSFASIKAGMYSPDTYVVLSIKGTIESISVSLATKHITDAYTLLRKYSDLIEINIYTMLSDDKDGVENENIDDWYKGQKNLPFHKELVAIIRKSKGLQRINESIFSGDYFVKIRKRCNDYSHANSYSFTLLNCDKLPFEEKRIKMLDVFRDDLLSLFTLHFLWVFTLRDHYMMSVDHVNYLEMGLKPPENSQYWVAKYVKDAFEKYVKRMRPDLAKIILDNTAMELE